MSSNPVEAKERSGGNSSTSADFTNSDWICGDTECMHVNFGRRTICQKCQKDRSGEHSGGNGSVSSAKKKLGTEIGKAAAEKSRGLFSAEDWQCSKCANVNWARRQTCNMCNAPKFCDVEERTGYGGGYNDRGVVEYRERSDSDSEYDEFGRLKKRKGNRNQKEEIIEETTKVSSYEIAEDDDDDEEEDGDGDLSKYDLWGDDEVVAAAVKTTVSKSNDKTPIKRKFRSRSRSRSSSSTTSFTSRSSSTTVSTRSSSSTSSSSRGRRTSHSQSSSTSTFGSRCSRTRQPHRQHTAKLTNEEKQKSISQTRSISKTHSHQSYSSHKSNHRTNSKSRSRSTSSAKKRQRERTSRIVRSRNRSRSGSRKYSCSNASAKYKRSNKSRLPKASYRKRSRTRSRSISAGKRRR